MVRTETMEELEDYARRLMLEEKLSCAETVLKAMARHWGSDDPLIPRIATPFRGGLCGTQQVCGAVTGGLMAIGIRLGRETGSESSDDCLALGKRYMAAVHQRHDSLDCLAITGLDRSVPEQETLFHGSERIGLCVGLVQWCCRWLAENVPD